MNNEKMETAPRQQFQSPENGADVISTNSIVPKLPADVKALRELRDRHIPAADIVETVRTFYPKYDDTLHSKCVNGDKYGIRLRSDAMRALLHQFAPDRQNTRRKDRRTKPHRVQARLSEAVYGQLQRLITQSGVTMQDFIEGLIFDYIAKQKGETP